MTKRILVGAMILLLGIVALWATKFYQKNLRGAGPAVFGAPRDIAALISSPAAKLPLSHPAEFELSIFAQGLLGVRVIAFDPKETLLVSLPAAGKIVALPDTDNDGRADRSVELLTGLNRPHGLAFSSGPKSRLFVAETDRIMAYEYDPEALRIGAAQKIVDLPAGGRHQTRSLLFMPAPNNNKLLVSVGSSCDSCKEEDWRRAKILIIDLADKTMQTFASGLRNAVFMTLHRNTKQIWATEMGRDYLGDNLPPDEINLITAGRDYGWPFCYGNNVADAEYLSGDNRPGVCKEKTPAFIEIQAHSAPLGLDFFPIRGWPEKYQGKLLVAYHGSWNRTTPTGYKLVLFSFDGQGNPLSREDFVRGWLGKDGTSLGRPVDVKITDKGHIYISDDKAGVVYRMIMKQE